MTQEIELPDYLPNRYLSWYHLYMDVIQECVAAGITVKEDTDVKIAYFGDKEEEKEFRQLFAEDVVLCQKFPIGLIKARAFDYVVSKIPNFETMNGIREQIMNTRSDDTMLKALNNLIDICPNE